MRKSSLIIAATFAGLTIASEILCQVPLNAQVNLPRFEVDTSWPKPLPDRWTTGQVGGVCVDAQDHVFIVNRQNLADHDLDAGYQAPPVVEFDPEGNVVNSWGDPDILGKGRHGCFVEHDNSVWLPSDQDGIVQKFTHDGKLLLQIGNKGIFDSSDGTFRGLALNSSHTQFFKPAAIAVDPRTDDIYIADGVEPGCNHRVVVFDRNGRFLRQWGLQATKDEADAGSDVEFMPVVHCLVIGNDGFVYACDRRSDRIQVFDKMGAFQRNIVVPYEQRSRYTPRPGHVARASGTSVWIGFSPDPTQKFMYVVNEDDEQIDILDHATGQVLSSFGRAGHLVGQFTHAHALAVDSKGNIYVAEMMGHRVQKFRIMGSR